MLRKNLLFITLALAAGTWLAGCAPAPAPPAPHGARPGAVPSWDWFTGAFCCLTPLVIGAAILLIIAALIAIGKGKWPSLQSFSGAFSPSAREIVRARYARGEIDRQEYRQLLKELAEQEQSRAARPEEECM
ncbi:MAG TPA: hypothetical protein G4N97_01280 [Thermoflexia bacterium]|nr:MAG: hypothetical protein DRI80_10895 [Chloroflexota bacterium]HEY66888.1 hypothetical protein [Thermoflexia bacterium]